MQGLKNGERRRKNGKKQALESQDHPKPYLVQFGSSVITEQTSPQKHPPPTRPMEKYTF